MAWSKKLNTRIIFIQFERIFYKVNYLQRIIFISMKKIFMIFVIVSNRLMKSYFAWPSSEVSYLAWNSKKVIRQTKFSLGRRYRDLSPWIIFTIPWCSFSCVQSLPQLCPSISKCPTVPLPNPSMSNGHSTLVAFSIPYFSQLLQSLCSLPRMTARLEVRRTKILILPAAMFHRMNFPMDIDHHCDNNWEDRYRR